MRLLALLALFALVTSASAYDSNTGRCEVKDFTIEKFRLDTTAHACVNRQCPVRLTGKLKNAGCLNAAGAQIKFVIEDGEDNVIDTVEHYPLGYGRKLAPGQSEAFSRTVIVPEGKLHATVIVIEVYQ